MRRCDQFWRAAFQAIGLNSTTRSTGHSGQLGQDVIEVVADVDVQSTARFEDLYPNLYPFSRPLGPFKDLGVWTLEERGDVSPSEFTGVHVSHS